MQSIFHYRRLRHRLQLEYDNNHEKLTALSRNTQNSSKCSFLAIPQISSKDVEKASGSCPNLEISASKPGLSHRDLTLARSTEGVTVRDRSDAEVDDEEVFVVEAGSPNELNPQNWTRSSRIWIMCVLPICYFPCRFFRAKCFCWFCQC